MLKVYEPSGNVLFEEKQKYPKWIKWIVTFGMIMTIVGVLVSVVIEKTKTEDLIMTVIVIPVCLLGIYLNSNVQLEKLVTSNGLYYKWRPWHKRFRVIEKEDIESFQTRKFMSFSYGFGWFPRYGRYHNASSGEGLQLYLKTGKRFYFSTADIDSLKKAISQLINPVAKTRIREF